MKHRVILLLCFVISSFYSNSQENIVLDPAQIDSLLAQSQQGTCAFFTIVTTADPPTCNDFMDGSVSVDEPVDGVGPYSYFWVGGPASQIWGGLGAGTYTVIVVDNGQGASCSQDVILNEPSDLTVFDMNATAPSCFGVCDGGAFPLVIGGNGGNMYSYDSGETTQLASMLCNPFTLTITDSEGCSFDTTFTYLNEPDPIALDPIDLVDIDCFGNDNGSIDITIIGGTGPFDTDWTGPGIFTSSDEDISMLASGTYDLIVTDANMCPYTDSFLIEEPDLLEVDHTQIDNLCFGDSLGSIDAMVTGGTIDYSYNWNGPDSFSSADEDISMLISGTYNLTVTDMNGCMEGISVDVLSPDSLEFNEVISDITCFGFDDGAIDITIMGGTMPYSVSWIGPPPFTSVDEDISSLEPGDYTATILDGSGCTVQQTFTVNEPDALTIDPTLVENVSCIGDSDGSIDITITGGTVAGAYDISWTGPVPFTSTLEDISPLAIGTYIVTVTDDNGCTEMLSIDIEDPLPVTVMETITDVSCGALADGGIDIDVAGGAFPYDFAWTGPGTYSSNLEDISGLEVGTYDLTITDDNGCVFMFSYDIIQLAGYTLDFDVTHVVCFGENTGAIDMIIAGGVAPFNINWTGPGAFGSTDEDISDLIAGTYTVDVIDADMCTKTADVIVMENDTITIDAIISDITCFGFDDGAIDITIMGGTMPYSVSWIGPPPFTSVDEDISSLEPGDYTATILDGSGCTVQQTFTVNEPDALTIDPTLVENVSCIGDSDGSIDITITGGTVAGAYDISWTGPVPFTSTLEDISPLAIGTYIVTVTDDNGCTEMLSIDIEDPLPVTVMETITDVSCGALADGGIDIDVAGGAFPYDFAWTGPGTYSSNLEDISGLEVGTYDLTITDDNGCVFMFSYDIIQLAGYTLDFDVTHVACFGENTGAIDMTIAGGIAPFDINWTGPGAFGSTDEDISDLIAGTYTVDVIDADMCAITADVIVMENDTITIDAIISDITCFGFDDGAIDITIMGGTMPYSVSWIGPPPFTSVDEDISSLEPGDYTVTILDGSGCTVQKTFTVNEPDALTIDPTLVENVSCIGDSDGSIDITITGGTVAGAYDISWTGPVPFTSTLEDISPLAIGTYIVTVTDDNGCTEMLSIDIEDPLPVTVMETIMDVSCSGLSDGSIDIDVTGGASPYGFLWTGPALFTSTDEDIDDLEVGTYDLVITDDNDCIFMFSYEVGQLDGYILEFVVTDVACFGDSTGAIDMIITGGVAPFNINWTGPGTFSSTDEDIADLIAGSYSVTVEDTDMCIKMTDVEVMQNDTIIIDLGITPPTCAGDMDGEIDATVTGGVEPYVFSWTGPSFTAMTEDIDMLLAGTYFLLLTDSVGCTQLVSEDLIDPLEIEIDGMVQDLLCFQDSSGAIDVTIINAIAPYGVSWTGPSSYTSMDEDIMDLIPGTYTITVIDGNGCSQMETFEVVQPDEIVVSETILDVSCFGPLAGAIFLDVSGGTEPYDFSWVGPGAYTSMNEDILGIPTGTYDLTITDDNGCIFEATYFVDETPPITLDAIVGDISCNGEGDGSIDLTVAGGTMPYMINWTGPGTYSSMVEDIDMLEAGTYSVEVEDVDGCVETMSYDILEPDTLDLSVDIMDPSCPFNDGTLEAFPSGGTQPYSIEWSFFMGAFISNDSLIEDLAPGNYVVTITDANDCFVGDTIAINHPDPTVVETVTPVTCPDGMDGAIDLEVMTDDPPAIFSWTGPNMYTSALEDISGLEPGTYTVDVVDQALCAVSLIIEVPFLPPIEIDAVLSQIACAGNDDGAIDLTISNAAAPYVVSWTGPPPFTSSMEDISGLEPGFYDLLITDASGCSADSTFEITEGAGLELEFDIQDISCINLEDGAIDMTIVNGTAPFNIAWFGPNLFNSDQEDISDLEPGEYTLNIIDANICFTDTILEVLEPDSILLGISTTPSLCSYSDEGSITLDSLGGAMPYDITWTGPNAFGSVMQDIADLFPGSYELLVMDANGCLEDTTLFISAPDTLMVSFQIDDPSCLLDNGQVVAMVTGGTAAIDHSYEWFDDMGMMIGTNDTLENVGSGVYELVILDDNLCTDTISVSISDENYTVDEIVTNISCNAEDDGSIELTITGAQLPITINWMGPDGFVSIDEDIFDLEPGVYELTVIDDLGCSYFNTYEVTEPEPIDIVAILSNPPCFGADNGSIELDVTGGTNDFIYSWVGPVPFTSDQEDIFDLEGGTYDLNITDTDGCSTNASYDLDIPLEIVDTATILMGPICNGVNSGFIDLEIDGGLEPYTFSWVGPSFASATEDIINLEAGAYTVTVTDSLGCALDFSYDLDNITEIVATSDVSNVTCFGFEDGIIDFFPAGGTSPYDFDWVGPGIFTSSDQNLTDLIPGTYTVTVIDDDNCQNSFDIEVTTPDTLEVFFNVFDPICSYLENGAIDITITGGTTPYDIDWQGPNAFASDLEDISLLGSGLYSVTITDSLMCTWQGDTTLFSPDDIQVQLDSITSPFCSTSPDGAIYITGSGGTGVLSYEWTGPLSYSSLDEDALNVTAGTFDIQITDDNSCALDTFFITTPQIFVVADAGVFGELCDGDTILLDGTNSIAVENYEWVVDGVVVSTDPTFELTLDLSTSMVILNAEGSTCTDSDTLDLSVNELPFVDAGPDLIGFIEDIIAIGGDPTTDPDNIVSWSPSLNLDDTTLFNPNATVQTDQWYIVLVTSPFGCVSQDSMFIDLQAPVDIPNTITPNDDGYNDSWVLDGSLNFPNMEVEIYNRWGEKLFRSVGYSQPWDGTYEGNNVPIGTYYYIIRLNDPMFPGHLDGPISIMR